MSVTPFNGTQSGTYTSTLSGPETFTRTVSNQNGVRTSSSVFTLADGKTVTRDATFTKTSTGWTRDVTTTLADGRTSTLQETGTTQAGAPTTVTGTFQIGNQAAANISGTDSSQGHTFTSNLTYYNPWGTARTHDVQSTVAGDTKTTTASGTSFAGTTFSNSGALTILQSQSS